MRFTKISCGLIAASNSLLLPSVGEAKNPASGSEASRKNVLMIVVDDWGAYDCSYAGSKYYETPNLDQLAGKSVVFNQGYVSYPRSVPSRYSLFTGMHCARPQSAKGEDADERKVGKKSYSIAEPFQQNGYDTFFIGKWHLATNDCLPQDKGFNTNIGGGKAGATSSHFYPFNTVRKGKHKVEKDIVGMDDAAPNEYLTDYMSRKVVSYIEAGNGKPFFAVCSFYAVHTPLEAKPELIAKYEKKKRELGLNNDGVLPEEAGVRKVEQNNPVYAAMIQSVDEAVGNMIAALKKKGVYENTVIVVIGDNGGLSNRGEGNNRELATSNAPLKAGKGHLYEGGIRVPMLIHLPGQNKQIMSDALVAGYDLFPTLTDICSVPLAEGIKLDGSSLKPLLKSGNSRSFDNRKLFWHKAAERPASTGDYVSTAVRSGNYKLIDFYEQGRVELYNLKEDPSEMVNIAESKRDIADALMKDIQVWRKEFDVVMAGDVKERKANKEKKERKKEAKRDKAKQDETADN